ncbi:MAG: sensor histidine kinase [Microbacteriaceae bacterium]|uniref:sensor histidine kinase n=1 Tax=Microbacterium sp. TaxID=51671 RepID=UPI003F97F0A5
MSTRVPRSAQGDPSPDTRSEPVAPGLSSESAPSGSREKAQPAPARASLSPARAAPTQRELRQDYLLAAALFVAAMISGALSSITQFYGEQTADLVWVLPLAMGTTLPLAVRRRLPITAAVVVCASYFCGVTLYVPEAFVSNVSMFIAIYTIGAWMNDRRRAVVGRVIMMVAMMVWLLISTYFAIGNAADEADVVAGAMSPLVAYMLIQWLINVAYFGGAYYMGDHAYRAALNRQDLRRLAEQLEEERELSASQAVALDRVRIARELHDVVGHHVSAMGVQAGAARTIMATNPDAAGDVLREVEQGARTAIDELHHLLDTLRDPGENHESPSALKLQDLDQLVRQVTAAGTPTTFTVIGDAVPLPPLIETNLYRIAQEALTNARRHAGPDARADIRLRYRRDTVELEVTNTGRVRAGARPGVGQLGMRERATSIGGVLHFGHREAGSDGSVERPGYLVRISVPLRENPTLEEVDA